MNRSQSLPDRMRKMMTKWRAGFSRLTSETNRLDDSAVRMAYARWAPYYDMVFRAPLYWGRQAAVKHINALEGHVLEAGVGTGMSLPHYRSDITVTGIDVSEEMLARAKLRAKKLTNIRDLTSMDAGDLSYPDDHFDVTVAMYVITVVPDPIKVLRELERVTKPGGTVVLVNHFSADSGLRSLIESALKRFANHLGWHSEFPKSRILGRTRLHLEQDETLPPFGLFTMMIFKKPV